MLEPLHTMSSVCSDRGSPHKAGSLQVIRMGKCPRSLNDSWALPLPEGLEKEK